MPDEDFVEGTPLLLGTTLFRLEDVGYQQSEYFIKGTAHSYVSAEPLTSDGKWMSSPQKRQIKTLITVYTPIDAERFNDTVIIEWSMSAAVPKPRRNGSWLMPS